MNGQWHDGKRAQRERLYLILVITLPIVLMVGYFVYVVALRDKLATCPPSCREQVMVGKDLRNGNWRGVDFQYANLSQANLAGADLGGADFYFANLAAANLAGAQLPQANLVGAALDNANLEGAKLGRANLRGARLQDARLAGADLGFADLGDLD